MATATEKSKAKAEPEAPKIASLLPYHNGVLALGEDGAIYRVDIDRGKFEGRASRAKGVVFRKLHPEEAEKAADKSEKSAA
jgi:hypothetical protein